MSRELRDIRIRLDQAQARSRLCRNLLQLEIRETRRRAGGLLRLLEIGLTAGRILAGVRRGRNG